MRNCLYALKTFFWFSPINQWLYDDIYEMGERECDTFVTKDMEKEERYQYARFLLRMESEYQKKVHDQRTGYYAFFQGRESKYMKQRLESVMLFRQKNKKSKVKQFAAAFLMCAIFGCLVYGVEIVSVQAEDRIYQKISQNQKQTLSLVEELGTVTSPFILVDEIQEIKVKERKLVEYDIDQRTKKQPHGDFLYAVVIKDVPEKKCVPLIQFYNKKEQIIEMVFFPYKKREKENIDVDCMLNYAEKGV